MLVKELKKNKNEKSKCVVPPDNFHKIHKSHETHKEHKKHKNNSLNSA